MASSALKRKRSKIHALSLKLKTHEINLEILNMNPVAIKILKMTVK